MRCKNSPVLVIGVGNDYRHDDGAGRRVARALQPASDGLRVMEQTGEGAALMEAWNGAETVILIDAISSGGAPGTIYRLDAAAQPVPSHFFHGSSHAFSVAEAVELSRTLDQLPPHLLIYGIEGSDFSDGAGLSPEVARAVLGVAQRVRQEIESLQAQAK